MSKKKLLDCSAKVIYLMLCIGARVLLAKEIPEKISAGAIKFLDQTAETAKKWMSQLDE